MSEKAIYSEVRDKKLKALITEYHKNSGMTYCQITEQAFKHFFSDEKFSLMAMSKEQLIDEIIKLKKENKA